MPTQRPACVYTVLTGGYETLNEQPVAASSGMPFICLTDDPGLTSKTWQVVHVPTAFAMDPIRSQRLLKICAHRVEALSGFGASLYIDNSVLLKVAPEDILARLQWDSGMGVMHHSERDSVHDEFLEVARLGFDDLGRIFEQLNHYLIGDETSLTERPYWNAILLRDHEKPEVGRAMDLWASHVMRYSRRDQLSLNTVLRRSGLQVNAWPMDNRDSWFHAWPHTPDRERFAGTRLPMNSLMPMKTRLHELEGRCVRQQHEMVALQAARDAALRSLRDTEQRLADLSAHTERLSASHRQLLDDAERLRQSLVTTTDAFRNSTSWRITAPLRRLRSWRT